MSSERRHRVAVAVPHPAGLGAARDVLQAGGNAVDAAIAAAAVLAVVYPHMCSLGGDAVALLRSPGGEITSINASGGYGSGKSIEELFGDQRTMPLYGALSVSVPGVVSGWDALHRRGGKLPIGAVLAPAILLARSGCEVSLGLANAIATHRDRLEKDPGMRDVFFEDGSPLTVGETLFQSALAETLESLAEFGLQSFYSGDVSSSFSSGLAALGVPITQNDLAAHSTEKTEAITISTPEMRVSTAPPNSQGFTLLRIIGALSSGQRRLAVGADTGLISELFYASDRLRDELLADPRFVNVPIDDVLSDEALASALHAANDASKGPRNARSASARRPDGDTVAISVVDDQGTAVSLIQSVFFAFGSGLLEPETGIVLQNRAASFSLDAGSLNVVAPHKRPAHTLVPVIVEYADGSIVAQGTMGGKAQSQIHAQLILYSLSGLSPDEAVGAPRFVVGAPFEGEHSEAVQVEGALGAKEVHSLTRTGLPVSVGRDGEPRFGHAMIARLDVGGALSAGADPRSDGSILIF